LTSCSPQTPPIKDSKGNVITASIASIEKVHIGGIDQTIILRSFDTSKPVLLFVHGGPGMPEGGLLRKHLQELEKSFIVVDWEQRGAGLTGFESIPTESLSIEQMKGDLVELSGYLLRRFKHEKIFLFCHSFGTLLGTLAIRDNPELYAAYIGSGQIVDQISAEQTGYSFCLEMAKKNNHKKALKQLSELSIPSKGSYSSDKYPAIYKAIMVQRKWLGKFGGIVKDPDKVMPMMISCVFTKEHALLKSIGIMNRFEYSVNSLWPQIMDYNLLQQVTEIKVPIYIIGGKYDKNTPDELVKEYLDKLVAPKKEFIQFEHSAHFAPFEEPDKFSKLLIERVLIENPINCNKKL
jgi:pimeloyl-ACP methyl ester carboxylesterase